MKGTLTFRLTVDLHPTQEDLAAAMRVADGPAALAMARDLALERLGRQVAAEVVRQCREIPAPRRPA